MKSTFEISAEQKIRLQIYIKNNNITNGIYPEHFLKIMSTHHGLIDIRNADNEEWLDPRNPLIVTLGDSVTAGYFETIDLHHMYFAQDPQDGYGDKLLHLLHEEYPMTVPSLINSGIAGDNIHGMKKRLNRDVLSHDPDLVILNASLNWTVHRGTIQQYTKDYDEVVQCILENTEADIVLTTAYAKMASKDDPNFFERSAFIRTEAAKYSLPLVDLEKIFTDNFTEEEVSSVMSNGVNHPAAFVHTVMAEAIMQIMKKKRFD